MWSNSYFGILAISESLVTSKVFNLEVFVKCVVIEILRPTPLGLLKKILDFSILNFGRYGKCRLSCKP